LIERSLPCGDAPYWDVIRFRDPIDAGDGNTWTAYPSHEDPYYTFQVAVSVTVTSSDGTRWSFDFETGLHREDDPTERDRFRANITAAVQRRWRSGQRGDA
jgi:hypothetical protein